MAHDALLARKTIELFTRLGLTKNEVKCYLAALRHGPGSVVSIARAAGVHRVNAYSAITHLVSRGLLMQEMKGARGRLIHPAPLAHLQELALEQQKRATKLRWKIEDLIPALAATAVGLAQNDRTEEGEVLFFRGDDTYYRILDRTLAAPAGSTICFLESFDYFISLPDNPGYDQETYIPTRLARNLRARILHHPDEYARKLRRHDASQLRETRFLPPEMHLPCSVYIYGNEASFLWTREQGNRDEARGLVIIGGPLVDLMQKFFDLLWERSSLTEKRGA